MNELWNDQCPCGHDWERHSISDGGCGADWEYDGPDPGIPSKHGCMCQLAHTDRSAQ